MNTDPNVIQAITDAADKYGVDRQFALNTFHQESGINPNVKDSSAGAIGIGQLMPGTAKDLGVDPRDPAQNIDGSVRYMRQMHDQFGGDHSLAAAAYNAGPQRVKDYLNSGRALPDETTNYMRNVAGPAMTKAFAQNQPSTGTQMPDNSQGPSTLFGGNPTPIGGLGALGRMLGIGSEPDLGRHLQNAGAALIAPSNPSGAAALQNAANMPLFRQRFTTISDKMGNQYAFDNHTGGVRQLGVSPQSGQPGQPGQAPLDQQQLDASSPNARAANAELMQKESVERMSGLDAAANDAQAAIDMNNKAIRLSQNPGVIQGPGLWNMLKEKLGENTNGSLGGVDLPAHEELDKLNKQLQGAMLSAQKGVRFAGPEIKFGEMASADLGKPAATNQEIYRANIANAQRIIDARDLARDHMDKHHVLGNAYSRDLQAQQEKKPVYQDTVIPSGGSKSTTRPPLSDFFK